MNESKDRNSVDVNLKQNLLLLTFSGIIRPREIDKIYTDVRFCIADLAKGYNVIADFSRCRLMYLSSLKTFKKIFQYMLDSECGEIIRVIQKQRIISKQILNYTFAQPGYKPSYLASREEAERKITGAARRDGIRFQLREKPVLISCPDAELEGFIVNISVSGCAITTSASPPRRDTEVELRFTLKAPTATRDFHLGARVVRHDNALFAVAFTALPDTQKTHLKACLIRETEHDPI